MTREELLSLVKDVKKEFSLPLEEGEEAQWEEISPFLTVKLTGLKSEADKITFLKYIREKLNINLKEAKKILDNNEFPIIVETVYNLLPNEIPPILKKYEDTGAIVDYDYDFGTYIE